MKFKSLLLAATGLFALASATSTTSPQGLDAVALVGPASVNVDPAQCEKSCHLRWVQCVFEKGGDWYADWWCNCKLFSNPDMFCRHSGCVQDPGDCTNPHRADVKIAGRAATELAPDSTNVDPADCDKYCHQQWLKCVAEHGGSPDAERGCNCALFYNPDLFCRHAGCVQPPQGCDKKTGAVDAAVTASVPILAQVTKKCELDSAIVNARSEDLIKKDDKPADGSVAIVGPPVPPCASCQAAINSCGKNCGKPGELCAPDCQCFHKRNNQNCKGCKLNLNCDEKRSSEVTAEELVKKDDQPAADSVAIAPPPPNPCVTCQSAINSCGDDCATKGACDDTCRCYHKMYNINCKKCKVNCDCGHVCPRLALKQRRTEPSVHDLENMCTVESVIARVPNPCVICENSIKICKKSCNGDAGCENDCNCKWKKNLNCKECGVPCTS